jgi:hypothetical protein
LRKVATQKGKVEEMRAARQEKLREQKEEAETAAVHKTKMRQVKKEKPKKPTKGPDSSLLCFNLETRKVILAEPEFKGANMGIVGAELRKRWAEQTMEQQMAWDKKAQENKESYKLAMAEYQTLLDIYNGKEQEVAATAPTVAPGGPRVDPEFLRRNFKGWLMKTDGLYLALMEKTLHIKEQFRPLFVAAGREDELTALCKGGDSDQDEATDSDVDSPTRRFKMIVLTNPDCVPAELESKMLEVRTVKSAEHLTDRAKAVGMLEREIVRAMEIGDFGDDRSMRIMGAAEDNEQFGFA